MGHKHLTPQDIMGWDPCEDWTEERVLAAFGDRESLSPLEISELEDVPHEDRLWVLLRPEIIPEPRLHELSCKFAEQVLPIYEESYPGDDRPRRAIETKRKWLRGEATDEELSAAGDAVQAAVQAAASAADNADNAANAAAWDAWDAQSASRDAWDAWAAASAAASAAARSAWSSAWDARDASAWDARAASRDAAGDAQLSLVREVLTSC